MSRRRLFSGTEATRNGAGLCRTECGEVNATSNTDMEYPLVASGRTGAGLEYDSMGMCLVSGICVLCFTVRQPGITLTNLLSETSLLRAICV